MAGCCALSIRRACGAAADGAERESLCARRAARAGRGRSGFMRIALRQIIETDGDMRVVGEARNGEEAVALARELRPDVVTMDIEMPVMDGIEATRQILAEVKPQPIVIMVSSYTQTGAAAPMKALQFGAG